MNQPAQLLSPLIRGPKCLRFCYYMYESDIGNLDVLLRPREQQDNYLMWRRSGEQGGVWLKASADVGYTGESWVGREQMSILYLHKSHGIVQVENKDCVMIYSDHVAGRSKEILGYAEK